MPLHLLVPLLWPIPGSSKAKGTQAAALQCSTQQQEEEEEGV